MSWFELDEKKLGGKSVIYRHYTIESDVVKTLTDKQIETVVPIATDKLKTMNKNIYDN